MALTRFHSDVEGLDVTRGSAFDRRPARSRFTPSTRCDDQRTGDEQEHGAEAESTAAESAPNRETHFTPPTSRGWRCRSRRHARVAASGGAGSYAPTSSVLTVRWPG